MPPETPQVQAHRAGQHPQFDVDGCAMCRCESESFVFHCATGGDLECECGFHVLPAKEAPQYRPEDFG